MNVLRIGIFIARNMSSRLGGKLFGELVVVGECLNKFCVRFSNFDSETTDGLRKSCHGFPVCHSCVDKVGYGVNGVLLPFSVVALINRDLRSLGRFNKFLMGDRKVNLELCPGAGVGGFPFPDFTIIIEHTSSEDDIKCCVKKLDGCEGGITGGRKFDSVFNLTEKVFNGDVTVVYLLHTGRVGLKIGSVHLCIGAVDMI